MNNNRVLRMNSEVQKIITDCFIYKLGNPRLHDILSVNYVRTSADLSYCKIGIGLLNDNIDKVEIIKEVEKATGFIKKEIANNLNLRVVPELKFIIDENAQYGLKIEQILKTLNIPEGD